MALGSTQTLTEMSMYQEHFLWGKDGRCVRLTNLPSTCAVVMKFENLNFLEPSGPHQACNGTALSFRLNLMAVFYEDTKVRDCFRVTNHTDSIASILLQ